MKSLKERKSWKILLGVILVIAVLAAAGYIISSSLERKVINENYAADDEAADAGYDETIFVCTVEEPVTLDGTEYVKYHAHWESFVDGDFEEDFLIKADASYIDETNQQKDGLIVYGRTTGYANDPNDTVLYDPGKYKIVEPYKIGIYKQSIDMWAVAGILVVVIMIEMVLVTALIIYFIVYFIKRARYTKQNP